MKLETICLYEIYKSKKQCSGIYKQFHLKLKIINDFSTILYITKMVIDIDFFKKL